VTAFHPLRTLDGPELPLKVEQPSFGKTARTDEDRLYTQEPPYKLTIAAAVRGPSRAAHTTSRGVGS